MINLLLWLLSAFQIILICLSIVLAVKYTFKSIKQLVKKDAKLKDWIVLIVSIVYLLSFTYMIIFQRENLMMIFSMLAMGLIIFSTRQQKYEDRKAGRRWWNW